MQRDTDASGDGGAALVDRREERAAFQDQLIERQVRCLHLYGPHGAGKTHLVKDVVQDLPARTPVCHLSCVQYDTQYKVLTALCNAVADGDFTTGYHTAQLYTAFSQALDAPAMVIVLDDVDFLLMNDGSDLLYALSRLEPQRPRLVLVSANHAELASELDARPYSSLMPVTVECPTYPESTVRQILAQRAADWITQEVTEAAIDAIAATTSNIALGSRWLTVAEAVTDGPIDEDIIRMVQTDAVQRYRTAQLAPFSAHHRLLLDAITLLTADTTEVRSGAVYDWYQQLCARTEMAPLSTRRISDFLTQLELLGLIEMDRHYGGELGKTRYISLQQLGK